MKTFTLSDEAYRVLCGLVAEPDQIDVDYVLAKETVWEELRGLFPVSDYRDLPPNDDGANDGSGSALVDMPTYPGRRR